jgi:anti-sigma factor RsiW
MSEIEAHCTPFAGDLSAWIDGELDAARGREVETHVRDCDACARRADALRAVDVALGALASAGEAEEAQRLDRVRARALAGLRSEPPQRLRAPRRPRRWLLPAAAGAVAAAAAALFVSTRPAEDRLVPTPIAVAKREQAENAAPAPPTEDLAAASQEPPVLEGEPIGASAVADERGATPATPAPTDPSDADLELAAALEDLEARADGDLELVEQLDLVEALEALDAPERG